MGIFGSTRTRTRLKPVPGLMGMGTVRSYGLPSVASPSPTPTQTLSLHHLAPSSVPTQSLLPPKHDELDGTLKELHGKGEGRTFKLRILYSFLCFHSNESTIASSKIMWRRRFPLLATSHHDTTGVVSTPPQPFSMFFGATGVVSTPPHSFSMFFGATGVSACHG